MTDKKLIQALRHCASGDKCSGKSLMDAADRLEALLAENEHFREATKMMPKWRPASEPPKAAGDYLADMTAYLGGVKRHQEVLHFTTAREPFIPAGSWYKIDDFGYPEIVMTKDIISWMPLPSTEGVE